MDNQQKQFILPLSEEGYTVRERLAVLEAQFDDLREDVAAIRKSIDKTSDDVSQLVQMTVTGKMIWKALLWAGAAVSGTVAILYMLLSIKNGLDPAVISNVPPDLPHSMLQHSQGATSSH